MHAQGFSHSLGIRAQTQGPFARRSRARVLARVFCDVKFRGFPSHCLLLAFGRAHLRQEVEMWRQFMLGRCY